MNDALSHASALDRTTADRAAMGFAGDPRRFFAILLRGSLLLLPTFGFYRFWLTTELRRHLWADTCLGPEAFEYTGTARELVLGFLTALAILAPIYGAYFLLGIFAETLRAFASVPLFVLLYGFGQYAVFRARRYRASRTAFRGLRFWMAGTAVGYAWRALLWDLATLASLGLAYPWRTAALERYKMRATRYGDLAGDFVATGGALFRQSWWLWGLALLLPAGLVVQAFRAESRTAVVLAVAGLAVLLPVAYALTRGIQLRWFLGGVRFGGLAVTSDLAPTAVLGRFAVTGLAMLAWVAALAGLTAALGFGFENRLRALWTAGEPSATMLALLAAAALLYLVLLLGLGVIKRQLLDRGLWVMAISSLVVTNLSLLDRVTAAGQPASSLGEGLADALDVGAF